MNRFDTRQGNQQWTVRREGSASYVNVVSRTDFAPSVPNGVSTDIPLATGIWSADWVSGVLSVKYSSRTTWTAATTKVEVIVQNIAIIPEEPQTTFIDQAVAPFVATSTWLQSAAGTNRLETVALAAPIGAQLRVILRATNAHTASQTIGVTLTVDLIGRTS